MRSLAKTFFERLGERNLRSSLGLPWADPRRIFLSSRNKDSRIVDEFLSSYSAISADIFSIEAGNFDERDDKTKLKDTLKSYFVPAPEIQLRFDHYKLSSFENSTEYVDWIEFVDPVFLRKAQAEHSARELSELFVRSLSFTESWTSRLSTNICYFQRSNVREDSAFDSWFRSFGKSAKRRVFESLIDYLVDRYYDDCGSDLLLSDFAEAYEDVRRLFAAIVCIEKKFHASNKLVTFVAFSPDQGQQVRIFAFWTGTPPPASTSHDENIEVDEVSCMSARTEITNDYGIQKFICPAAVRDGQRQGDHQEGCGRHNLRNGSPQGRHIAGRSGFGNRIDQRNPRRRRSAIQKMDTGMDLLVIHRSQRKCV